ncbi:sodium-translocating pyrophosphatase [Propionimicrobium lymphophilum]|uniref:sodium-translocating pyrophosphatase n=1 Tax=Propionimicrobium lymphophilum TaxID=33012 RepID=UPI00254E590D|nr:sodium-translocating pyrophosphatase [Propionimicrobium lymphophilum]MDK7709774.1 sodium-translocating pyrophosphatase [Propionimicrobium lymphophilum]MDK7733964.1 sodium-translocating pyrophosphatase [Propionimicrobium lymphophilum]
MISRSQGRIGFFGLVILLLPLLAGCSSAEPSSQISGGGEANLKLPRLDSVSFFSDSINGHTLLTIGLLVCVGGLIFGVYNYSRFKRLPVHKSMLDISELIYQTCRAYLVQQIKFLCLLWVFIAAVVFIYYQFLVGFQTWRVLTILLFSLIGMLGSAFVAWFGIRVNTFANSRTSFAALRGKPYPTHEIPLSAGMSVGMVLISVELFMMLFIMLFLPGDIAGVCFIGFAIGESLGASALRIAGGIFTKIADIGSDLMKIVFGIKEDDARNPGVIADCTGDNAGDSVGPSADGFETYGVTGVALITFVLLAVHDPSMQVQLLVWIFTIRTIMLIGSLISYALNHVFTKSRHANSPEMDFERPLSNLVWLTSSVCIVFTFLISYAMVSDLSNGMWWKLSVIISCGTLAGALIPELVKIFTSTKSKHVKEVVASSHQGGSSLNILSGIVAGNFSAFWIGLAIVFLMAVAFIVSTLGMENFMIAPSIFAFGLVAFGFLGMGPVTIAVDSYGPVTDNAQSVYELSTIEEIDGVDEEIKRDFGFEVQWENAKRYLEENDGAGNTFKATAKPVLIGTAVVGATTMIFSIIMTLTQQDPFGPLGSYLSLINPALLLGLITGGCVIYWFSGASMQAVTTGAHRAVEFIKNNIKLDGVTRASEEDSKKVVEICTRYAQKGMLNIFLGVFFATLAFSFVDEWFFIGYLISIAIFGLFQAIYMANGGGAWDNAKKIVEVDLNAKGTPLHEAVVVGDTVGDPFKDTSSVSLNPIIKFSTLFGLLAVELAVSVKAASPILVYVLAAVFLIVAMVFVYRSFYQMRTGVELSSVAADVAGQVAVAEQAADGLVAPPIPDREAKRGI